MKAEIRLWDTQWMNIVNHENAYLGWDRGEAVAHAVRMTEQAMARNYTDAVCPPEKTSPLTSEESK